MRKLLSSGLMLVVFLGSVGMPLYKHTCLHDNITISTLFVSSDHCSDDHDEAAQKHEAATHDCCAPVEKEVVQDRCCSESVSLLSMSFSFFQHVELSPFIAPEIQQSADIYLKVAHALAAEKTVLYSANTDPPRPGGKEILKQICIWRL